MKLKLLVFWPMLALTFNFTIPDAALAYHDPGVQRWINRDPIGERGGRNLYNYSLNAPTLLADTFGLFTWDSSCSETERSQIRRRLSKACKTAKDNDCFSRCKIGEKGAAAMEKACNSKDGEGPPVKCERTHHRCQITARGTGCGWTDPRGSKTIHICMNQQTSECPGGPGCTLFHELAHREGGVGPDDVALNPDMRAYDMEKCAGCQ